MATYISNGTGDWTTTGVWLTAADGVLTPTAAAGIAPQSGARDRIIIRQGHTITYNTSGIFGNGGNGLVGATVTVSSASIILSGGTLRASRTQNTALTAFGTIFVAGNTTGATGSFLDWGTLNDPVSAVTSTISMSALSAGMAGVYVQGGVPTITVTNSACFCGLEKTRNTFLTLPAAAGQPVITVDSCRNWANNDFILIESDTTTTSRTLSARISNISGNTITLDTDVNFARLSGTRVGNFTSTVTYKTAEGSPAAYGIFINGTTNGIYQFSYMTCENLWDVLRRSDIGGTVSTIYGSIFYRSTYNLTQATFRGIAIQQLLTNTGPMNGIAVDGTPYDEVVIDDIAFNSQNTSTVGRGICYFSTNSLVKLKNSVCYKSYYGYLNSSVYKATLENCYLNSEFYINMGNTGVYNILNNCRIRTNTPFSYWDNLVNLQLNNCNITSLSSRAIVTNTPNSFGDITLNNCTLNNIPLSSYTLDVATTRTLVDANYNIFNPNNNNTYTTFNYFYHATTNSSITKNGITSLSFRPKVPNIAFVKTFTAPAIQGVTQKIKGNLRFDTSYGTATPPSITFGGAVSNTTFTCPPIIDTWHSFEYDLTPNVTGDIEIKLTGTSTLSTGFVYLDGLNLDPFIKDTRWYGYQVDKNAYRTINPLTTLTEAQVSALGSISNLDQLYDASNYWSITNPASSSYIDLYTANGTVLDFGNKNIVINNTGTALTYISATNTITLDAPTLSAGTNFDTLKTSGTVTLSTGLISNIDINAPIVQTIPTNLTGVFMLSGTLSYTTNTPIEVEYTNCTMVGVQNTGTAIVTIKRTNSTVTESDAEITTYAPTLIDLTLQDGYIALYDDTGTRQYFQNTDGTLILPANATGSWSYKIARYGYQLVAGSFTVNPAVGGTIDIDPSYIPDTFITQSDVSVVSGYTDLNTTNKIHDYLSYYLTTSTGINYGILDSESFGALSFYGNLTLSNSATSIVEYTSGSNTLKLKSSSLNDSMTFVIASAFTQDGGNTIGDNIKIRSSNFDSELYFNNVDTLVLYASESDRDNNTNPAINATNLSIYRFKYGSTTQGITFTDFVYGRLTVGGTTFLIKSAIVAGTNTIDFGTTGNIQTILNNQRIINTGLQKASKLIPHTVTI